MESESKRLKIKTEILQLFIVLTFLLIQINNFCYSQTYDYVFVKNNSIQVQDSIGTPLLYPWTGGMNSCQFSSIDLNFDGIKDLFIFDKIGNRILTFINTGTANLVSYNFAPEYAVQFPRLQSWVELLDYNNDGKEDIFTYSNGGIKVYKNISTTSLLFKLVKNPILSSYNGIYTNLFCLTEDFPAITDIDNDGDLDILNFWVLGKYVNYHKNLSMEKYNTLDSLDFKLTAESWGCFAESEASNVLQLDSCYTGSKSFVCKNKTSSKHSGSTLLAIDMNGDGLKDLLVGDVDYSNLVKLTNGGTTDTAFIIAQDTNFPSITNRLNIPSFPSAQYLDVDNDGKKDLLVSPFDPNLTTAESFKSSWLYKNTGTNSIPVFQFQTENFLQKEMIDLGTAAYPVLYDYDNDGLIDLFVSNIGYRDSTYLQNGILHSVFISKIALFKNIGTTITPVFKMITRDFAHISSLHLQSVYPTFGDINNDGKAEMIIGNLNGKLYLFSNNSTPSNPDFVLAQSNYQNINVGEYSSPQLFDLNKDGLLDLLIGERQQLWKDASNNIIARKGNINYYKNTGTSTLAVFSLITDSLGSVDVTNYDISNYGYSTPCFFRTITGETRLITGNDEGKIYYYKNIDNNLTGKFTLTDTLFFIQNSQKYQINDGIRSGVAIADINNDGYQDIFVGNAAGGLCFYKGNSSSISISETKKEDIVPEFNIFPNPAKTQLYIQVVDGKEYNSYTVEINDIYGKQLYTKEYSFCNQIKIPIADLGNGIYFCNIHVFNQKTKTNIFKTRKFIVLH
ncbi:MAG: FG-GAP-like repeat-containing protein [Bacteroidales bacterium]